MDLESELSQQSILILLTINTGEKGMVGDKGSVGDKGATGMTYKMYSKVCDVL